MSDPVTSSKLDRRALVLGAVFLLGGAAALTRFTRKSATRTGAAGPALSGNQFMLLEQVADTMIPATDTPGALGADVPAFVRDMLTDWASAATRTEIVGVLEAIERQAWAQLGAAFLELPPERRLAVLRRYDEEAALDAVYFAWAGPTTPGEPHYYRVQGPRLLIEWDNTQDKANHGHSVWRDPLSDFGLDVLAQHRAAHHR